MHGSGIRREDCPVGACSSFFLLCFCVCVCVHICVGGNGKAAFSTHRLSYESGSKLAAWWLNLISSHWISDLNLSLLCERRDASPFSIYVTMTMQYEGVILKGFEECVVIQYCTSALPPVHGDHCPSGLWLRRNWRGERHYTNKGVFTKSGFVSEALVGVSLSPVLVFVGEISSLCYPLQLHDLMTATKA